MQGRLCRSQMTHIHSPPMYILGNQPPIILLFVKRPEPLWLDRLDGRTDPEVWKKLRKGYLQVSNIYLENSVVYQDLTRAKNFGSLVLNFPSPSLEEQVRPKYSDSLTWGANREGHRSLFQHQWKVPGVEWRQDPPRNGNPKPPRTTCWAWRMKALRSAPLLHKVALGWGSWVAHSTYVWAGSWENWKTTTFEIWLWRHSSYMWGARSPLNTSQWHQ